MTFQITYSQTGKPEKKVDVAEGTTVQELLDDVLVVDHEDSTVLFNGRKIGEPYNVELQAGDVIALTDNNSGAVA